MPQVFKMGPYLVYFWSNENEPLEPVHVHISQGRPFISLTRVFVNVASTQSMTSQKYSQSSAQSASC